MARLGDIATYINGYAFKPSDWSDSGVPIIRIQDLTGNSYQANRYSGEYAKKYEVLPGDVLISWSASLGIYVWEGERAVLNQHIFKVVFDKCEVDKSFFVHQVQNILEKAASSAHGATMKHLTKPVFDALPFYLPPLEEQRRIAATLDQVSDLIAKRRAQLDKLDLLVKARFVEMFGGINDSKLYPYIPIDSFADVVSGGTPNRGNNEYWQGGTIPWVKTTELQNSEIYNAEEKITQSGLDNSSAKIIPANSILIAMYGQGKTRGMTGYLMEECATNQACACILPSKSVNQRYLWQYMILSYDTLRNMAKGGNQPNLNLGIIKQFPVIMPPLDMQDAFSNFMRQTRKSKFTILRSLDKLEILKKSLLQQKFGR